MGKRLWDLAKSRFEIATILLGHRHIVTAAHTRPGAGCAGAGGARSPSRRVPRPRTVCVSLGLADYLSQGALPASNLLTVAAGKFQHQCSTHRQTGTEKMTTRGRMRIRRCLWGDFTTAQRARVVR